MDIEMTIVITLLYIAFVVWGYSKKSSSETLTDVLPEQSDYDYTEYFPNEQLEDSYEQSGSDCGYINYFPDKGVDDNEEELSILNSSSSSTQVEVQIEMETDCATVGVIVADPWADNDYEDTVNACWDNYYLEQEMFKAQLEYQFSLPTEQYLLPPAKKVEVVVAKPIANESHVDYDKAEHHLMLSLMTIRQLKAEAKRVKLPHYGKMTKAELLSALKSFNTNA